MAKQSINVGANPNDNRGDSLRISFQKINANFTELYTALGLTDTTLNLGAFEFTGSILSTTDSSAIVIDQATTITSNLTVGGDLLPSVANGGDLGSAARPWRSLYVSQSTIYLGGVSLSLDANNNLTVNGSLVSGATGPAGNNGAAGATGADGADALWNYTAAYNGGARYAVGDLATYGGQLYYRKHANGGNAGDTPFDGSTFWDLIAAKGDTGQGVPTGGTVGQVLAKIDSTDYNTEWATIPTSFSSLVNGAYTVSLGSDGKLAKLDGLTLTAGGQFNICTIVNAGSGYNTGSALKATTGGSGTGMTVGIGYGLSNQLSNVSVVDPGTGYVDGDVITVSEGTGGTFVVTRYNDQANQGNNNIIESNWTFGTDGTTTLPGPRLELGTSLGAIYTNQSTGQISIGDGIGAGGAPTAPSTVIHIGGATNAFQISAYGPPARVWTFDRDGRTKFPAATVPGNSYGGAGDKAGMVVFDADYIYYCTADYVDNSTNIWKRTAHGAGTW